MIAAILATKFGRAAVGVVGAFAIAGLIYAAGHHTGYTSGVDDTRAAAVKDAVKRITDMGKNNAKFNSFSDRDRCRAIMRDSGLPADNCD